ncbi:g64 [Coccomyxa elongata]
MDLLALVMSDNQLSVNRLNKQRLWVLAPDSSITAISWQPDGKTLAIALQTEGIWLLDVENGEAWLKDWEQEVTVLRLTWTEEDPAAMSAAARTPLVPAAAQPRCCHGSTAGSAEPGAAGKPGTAGFTPEGRPPGTPHLPARLSVLCAADEQAHVRLLAFGFFLLGRVALPGTGIPSQPQQTSRILHAEMSRDLSRLCCVSLLSATGEVSCVVHDTSCIGQRCPELRRIAMLASQVTSLLRWCSDALEAAQKEWKGAMSAVHTKMDEFRAVLVSYGSASSAEVELQAVLATGHFTPAMQHFLSSILGEANIKRVARAVDAAVASVGRMLVDHMQCALEALALQLGDALGLAACSAWMAPLSLQEAAVREAAATAHALLLRAEALRRTLLGVGADYRTLFAWLLTLCRRVNRDPPPAAAAAAAFRADPHALAAFVRGAFSHDPVAPQLGSEELGEAAAMHAEERTGMRALLSLFGCAGEGTSMRVGLQRLERQCRGVLGSVQASMAPSIQPLLSVCIATFNQPHHRLAFTLPQDVGVVARMCFLAEADAGSQSQSLLFVDILRRGSSQEDASQLQVVSTEAKVEGWGPIADAAFYKEQQLAVLTSSGGGMDEAHFLLLPMEPILHASSGPGLPGKADGAASQVCKERRQVRVGSEGLSKRCLGYAQAAAPLAVSGSRGVACTFVGLQRIVLLDLEENEEDGDQSEDDQSEAAANE